jgi:hypothetical protein
LANAERHDNRQEIIFSQAISRRAFLWIDGEYGVARGLLAVFFMT